MVEVTNSPGVVNPFVGGVAPAGQLHNSVGKRGAEPEPVATGSLQLINVEELLDDPDLAVTRALDTGIGMRNSNGVASQALVQGVNDEGRRNLAGIASDISGLVTSTGAGTATGKIKLAGAGVNSPGVQNRWSDFISKASAEGGLVDVNALVQFVLRESYQESTKDLRFYADKVKFYNNLKKEIREDTKRLRDARTGEVGKDPQEALNSTVQIRDFETAYMGPNSSASTQTDAKGELSGAGAAALTSAKAAKVGAGLNPAPPADHTMVQTKGGYTITNSPDGTEVNFYNPDGSLMVNVWGDPHMEWDGDFDRDLNGAQSANFMGDTTFILPDGSKVFLSTEKRGGEYFVGKVDVLSGDDRIHIDQSQPPPLNVSTTQDRAAFDIKYADSKNVTGNQDASVMILTDSGQPYAKGDDGKWYPVAANAWDDQYDDEGVVTKSGFKSNRTVGLNKEAAALQVSGALQVAALDGTQAEAYVKGHATTVAELDTAIEDNEQLLNSVGDDAQLANVDLQNMLQKQQQTLQMMSNISKMLHDTAMAIIRKIGG